MSATTNLVTIESPEQFTSVMSADLNRVSLLNFWAPWAEPCEQMNGVVKELAAKYPKILCLNVSSRA
jgi:thiol-disulfide isomerase/thioredoxin